MGLASLSTAATERSVMRKNVHPDVYIGVIALIVSIAFFTRALTFPSGPNVFPMITLIVMIICEVIITAQGIQKTRKANEAQAEIAQFAHFPVGIWLAMGAYCLLFWLCGYVIATLVFMVAAQRILKIKSWKVIGLVAVGYLVLTYFVFVVQFGTPIDGFGLIGDYLSKM